MFSPFLCHHNINDEKAPEINQVLFQMLFVKKYYLEKTKPKIHNENSACPYCFKTNSNIPFCQTYY
jgi:hypothetical protein